LNRYEPKRYMFNLSSELSSGEAPRKLIPYKKFEPDGNHGHRRHRCELKGNPNGLNVTQFIISNSNWTRSKTWSIATKRKPKLDPCKSTMEVTTTTSTTPSRVHWWCNRERVHHRQREATSWGQETRREVLSIFNWDYKKKKKKKKLQIKM